MNYKTILSRLSLPTKQKLAAGMKGSFLVSAPCRVTICRNGVFSSTALIGEEMLVIDHGYVGKSGQIILKFREHAPGTHYEMRALEAVSLLDGFNVYLDILLAGLDEQDMKEAAESMKSLPSADEVRTKYKEDPLFGSW